MEEYEKINNEIKQLMNTSVKPSECIKECNTTQEGNVDQLIKILSDLIRVYKDIQLMLESNDNEGIKNRLLSDDIKISLVCESLMKVLKDECTEKKEAYRLLDEEKNKNKMLSMEMDETKHKLRKVESDVEYLSTGNKELNRIIQDQKSRVQAFKDKAELEKKGADTIRVINKELENLRLKALEKNEILVREMNVLKSKLNEKDQALRKIGEEIKEKERTAKGNAEKAETLEKNFNVLRKKLEAKEEALDVCNSELAKFIAKDKRSESLLEDLKGKAAYYERLYRAINKQNEYLNEQLAKLINVENAERIEISNCEDFKDQTFKDQTFKDQTLVTASSDFKKLKGYKKRLKKYKKRYFTTQEEIERNKEELSDIKRTIERLKSENERLQDEKEKAIDSNNKVTDSLLSKVESLLEKNRQYQRMLYQSKEESVQANESFKTVIEEEHKPRDQKASNHKEIDTTSPRDIDTTSPRDQKAYIHRDIETMFNDIKLKNKYDTKLKVRDLDSSTLFLEDLNPLKYQRSFRLDNDYDLAHKNFEIKFKDEGPRNGKDVEFKQGNAKDVEYIRNGKDVEYIRNGKDVEYNQVKEFIRNGTNEFNLRDGVNEFNQGFFGKKNTKAIPYDDFKLTDKESEDAKSVDSGKSLQTTSTLKEMLKKTENLQLKFDDLEKQLEEIKQSDEPQPKKLHDQIKAYTDYYYSDYLDLSNEEDFL